MEDNKNIILGAEFLNISVEEFKNRMNNNTENAKRDFEKYGFEEYDKNTEANIYGLAGFNTEDRIDNLLHGIKEVSCKNVLDFGGGMGTVSRKMEDYGNSVFYYDLPSKTQEFAKFISKKLNYNTLFLKEEEVYKGQYDVIITTDVLEHLKNPMEYIKKLDKLLVPGGIWLTTGLDFSCGPSIPMHLKENIKYRMEHNRFFMKNYTILYYRVTVKEIIYVFIKK